MRSRKVLLAFILFSIPACLTGCWSENTRYLVVSEATHFEIQGNGQALNLPVFAGTLGIDEIVRNVTTAEYYYEKLSAVYEFKSFTFVNTSANEILLDRAGDLHHPQSVYSYEDSTAKIELSLAGFQHETATYVFRISDRRTGQTRDHHVDVPAGKSASIGALFDREKNRGYLISISTESLDITKELTPARLSEFLMQKNMPRGGIASDGFKPGDQRWMDELFGERALKLPIELVPQKIPVKADKEPDSLEDIPDQEKSHTAVDKLPTPIDGLLDIHYPDSAKRAGIEGKVFISALILKNGTVGKLEVKKGLREDLDQAAMEAVRKSRWTPAEQNGKPVAVWVVIPFQFKLN